jgi:type I restriction enzyme S subunit
VKAGWDSKLLSDICEKITVGHVGAMAAKYKESGIPFLRSQNIRPFEVSLDNLVFIDEAFHRELLKSQLGPGDLAIVRTGYPGTAAVIPETIPICNCSDLVIVRPGPRVDPHFLALFFNSNHGKEIVAGRIVGAAQKHFNITTAKRVAIPLPNIREQQRIVAVIYEAFDGIVTAKANAQKNLQNAKEVFSSHLHKLFANPEKGWIRKSLIDLCNPQRGITYGVIKLGDDVPSGTPCLRTSNVRWLRIETEGMKRIAPTLSAEYSRTILRGGELLVNVRGTLGGVAVASQEMAGWNVSREIAVVPADPQLINPHLLCYLIGSGTSQEWLGEVKKGATYVGINLEDLRLLPVAVPPMAKQLEIVQHLDALQEETICLETLYRKKTGALDELKQSLLHRAFNGNL